MTLQPYASFAPTPFDHAGAFLPDRQDWLVAPVCQTRDSGPLEASNFATVLASIEEADPDCEDHESHSFNHWGPGWFEIILVRPGSKAAGVAEEWHQALEDYPIADDEDFSSRELEAACESWEDWARADVIRALERHYSIEIDLEGDGWDAFDALCASCEIGPGSMEHGSDGPHETWFQRATKGHFYRTPPTREALLALPGVSDETEEED